jgi:hypothetical protein
LRQPRLVLWQVASLGSCPQKLLDDNHEPERRIRRVVLGRPVALAEPVGQHSLVDQAGPGGQNRVRLCQPAGSQHQAAHRDERVAAPVCEPWKAGHNRLPSVAVDDIARSGSKERVRYTVAPAVLGLGKRLGMKFDMRVDETARAEDQDRPAPLEVEPEAAGRGEVLDTIEAAIPFGRVDEIAVPVWLGVIFAVADCDDLGQRLIRTPGDAWAIHRTAEVADRVLAMQRVGNRVRRLTGAQ